MSSNSVYDSHSEVTSSGLKNFLDRKVSISLRDHYVGCFDEKFSSGVARRSEFEKWSKNMCNQDSPGVTKGDARTVLGVINGS